MAERRPVTLIAGRLRELPAGDSISGASVTGTTLYAEPVVIAGFNDDVVHHTGSHGVPLFVTTTEGDIVTAGVQ